MRGEREQTAYQKSPAAHATEMPSRKTSEGHRVCDLAVYPLAVTHMLVPRPIRLWRGLRRVAEKLTSARPRPEGTANSAPTADRGLAMRRRVDVLGWLVHASASVPREHSRFADLGDTHARP
ncbi:hypothetical protein BD309DRAFT_858524 [Dichomitus squalens]|uniref:Uncharacterized protein n=1 Tax=Dichomitus squalens TaxID=114155 RepID=A0A4Q9PSJ7_9APHY|nr:hypothetical protein BD311DRAFT_669532 [Dichomitus squalens]TBU46241.1 hypothetical protein BD309DRAFT_858524 [Dichomitus squalens]TBU57360.1 hypothetical protein BD310DRAFT_949487 [Dichomitus squalens]